jgi:hypothetical protein
MLGFRLRQNAGETPTPLFFTRSDVRTTKGRIVSQREPSVSKDEVTAHTASGRPKDDNGHSPARAIRLFMSS